jgi:hypothetical protein
MPSPLLDLPEREAYEGSIAAGHGKSIGESA